MIISRKDLEAIAADVILRYNRRYHPAPTDRVDPIRLATQILGLTICHCCLSSDGSILGMTSMQPVEVSIWNAGKPEVYSLDGYTILVDPQFRDSWAGEGRYNFTVAHEIGHQIMFRTFPEEYDSLMLCRLTKYRHRWIEHKGTRRITDWQEWYADTLASAILLPPSVIYACLQKFGLPRRIISLTDSYSYRYREPFTSMAQHLRVSKQALAIRLWQLSILQEPYTPKTFIRPIDIYPKEAV